MKRLAGTRVLVTGGSSRVGETTAMMGWLELLVRTI